jgi:hypothetical protein
MFEYLKINRAPLLAIIHEPGSILHRYSVVFAPLKLLSAFIDQGLPLSCVGAAHRKQPSLILL